MNRFRKGLLMRDTEFTLFLEALRKEDEAAFGRLVLILGPQVYAWVRYDYPGMDSEFATEVVQETFICVWRLVRRGQLPCFNGYRHFLRWLRRMSRYRAADLYQQETRHKHAELLEIPGDDDAFVWQEDYSILRSAIAELPEKYRNVLVECCLNGKSPSEYAHACDQNPGTIRSILSRALAKLREILNRMRDEGHHTN